MAPTDQLRSTFEHDVFFSYAHADDMPWGKEGPWVTKFVKDFAVRLHMLRGGEEPRTWFDKTSLRVEDSWDATTVNARRSSALLVPILSPAFVGSKYCMGELQDFIQNASANRVVKVVKYPSDKPFPLLNIVEHRFYRQTETGTPRELTGEAYFEAIDRLTQQVKLLLDGLRSSNASANARGSKMEVFLCHSSSDKAAVRKLWENLSADEFAPWLDEKELLPGQNWELEIRNAIDRAGAIVVCLSTGSINKEGFLQREIKLVLDKADEKPEETIFLIPARLDNCSVPLRLKSRQWVDLFEETGYARLLQALQIRAANMQQQR